jgi:hypothetical protein
MNEPKKSKRYIGKIKNTQSKTGTIFQKILLDNTNALKQDGTEDPYYKGTLLWLDKETGNTYQVKQLAIHVPQNGMHESAAKNGFIANITLDVEDTYSTTLIK